VYIDDEGFDSINDEFDNEDGIPRIRIDSVTSVQDLELFLHARHDSFYRRIIDHVLSKIEGYTAEPIAILIDEDGMEYEMDIPEDGFDRSLSKANEYFIEIEEYETCDLIKSMVEIIRKKNEL
jgi:hypothetical protein